MNKQKIYPVIMVLAASLLFGASTPITKMLLGQIQPVPLAAFLYLGSGLGLTIFHLIGFLFSHGAKKQFINEAPLTKKDYLWLLGATVTGGIIAPIIILSSLQSTPSSTASLLLNFEAVATTAIAIIAFKENAGKQIIGAVTLITSASIFLSWDPSNHWGFSMGSLGIILACICWGIDNNFTRNISAKNPFTVVAVKGLAAGFFSLLLSLILKIQFPEIKIILIAMVIGFFCYGLSIVLFVFALRHLGAARTSALFGTAPFIGAFLSFILLRDIPTNMFIISVPFMILGAVLLLKEKHAHYHKHDAVVHEHRHCHDDYHHNHIHLDGELSVHVYHSHLHIHEATEHFHAHSPDINHRHNHS
jgi:drug/metabolite transporter (DMT)-like permease